jgi:hypothetical protein
MESTIENKKGSPLLGLIVIIGIIFLLFKTCSSFSNNCGYKGCNRKATGWKHYSSRQSGPFGGCIGCCKMEYKGGYCSQEHCAEDQ